MTVRKKFLNRQLEINQQYEIELNNYDEPPKSMHEIDYQLKKRLGELPPEPIYDYIDELSIEDFNNEEENGDFHHQSCLFTLQNESTLKK